MEQTLLLAEIGQKIFDLLVFLRIQTKNLFLCQDTIGGNIPQDAAGFVRVDLAFLRSVAIKTRSEATSLSQELPQTSWVI